MLLPLADGLVNPETDGWNLGSTAGIVTITFFIVEILKSKVKPGTPVLGKIPVWIYPIVIAVFLAILANKIIVIEGQPILAGNTWVVVGRALMAAASASGLFSMIRSNATTMGEAKTLAKSLKGEDNTMKPS